MRFEGMEIFIEDSMCKWRCPDCGDTGAVGINIIHHCIDHRHFAWFYDAMENKMSKKYPWNTLGISQQDYDEKKGLADKQRG